MVTVIFGVGTIVLSSYTVVKVVHLKSVSLNMNNEVKLISMFIGLRTGIISFKIICSNTQIKKNLHSQQ